MNILGQACGMSLELRQRAPSQSFFMSQKMQNLYRVRRKLGKSEDKSGWRYGKSLYSHEYTEGSRASSAWLVDAGV